jgi:hypothetical protein
LPTRSPETLTGGVRPAASLYAVVKSDCACSATASASCWAPSTVPGGNPVTAVPGLTPRSPVTTLGPVLVTVVPARTAKALAVPRPTGDCAALAPDCAATTTAATAIGTQPAPSQGNLCGLRDAQVKADFI